MDYLKTQHDVYYPGIQPQEDDDIVSISILTMEEKLAFYSICECDRGSEEYMRWCEKWTDITKYVCTGAPYHV